MSVDSQDAEELAARALDWLLASARESGTGLAWGARPSDDELDPTLYSGAAGNVITLLEAYRHFGDDRYAEAALRGAQELATAAQRWEHCSLYLGLAGMAVCLHAVEDLLEDSASGAPRPSTP